MLTKHYPPILLIALGLLFSINLHAANDVTVTWDSFLSSAPASSATVTPETSIITTEAASNTTGVNGKNSIDGVDYARFYAKTVANAGYVQCSFKVVDNYVFTPSQLNISAIGSGTTVTLKIQVSADGSSWTDVTTTTLNRTDGTGSHEWSAISSSLATIGNCSVIYVRLTPTTTSDSGKYLSIKSISISGTWVENAKSQWNKPTFAQGDYNGESLTYPVTISSEEGTTITYAVGTGAEQTTTTNSVTIDVAPLTSIKATVSGEGYAVSEQATFTTAATPAVATPTLTIGSYDYINGGYPVTPSCATDGATLTYTVSGAEPVECESGKPFYAVNTTVSVTATKKGYASATSEDVTLNIASTDDYSIPFQVKTDTYDKGKDHEYISYTIPGTYIAGINNADSKNNLKFRSNKASLTMVNGSTIANAIEIKVNEGYVIDKLYLKDFKANRDGIITISHVYVDGVEKTFAEMGRTDESITMNASVGAYTTAKAFSNLNATRSIIIELTNGTYGSGSPVDQFRAAIQTEYHSATLTLGQNGYSTFAADYDYTFTGAQAYKAAYDDATSTVSLTEITGTVPANEGIIFKGTEGETVTITKSVLPGEELTGNSLTGVTASTEAFLPGTNYVLASNGTATAFVKMATGKQVADMIGKAYLNIPSSGATPAAFYINATPTGVTAVEKAEENIDAPAYNIAGQRVASSAKGLVIIGGRKFINK